MQSLSQSESTSQRRRRKTLGPSLNEIEISDSDDENEANGITELLGNLSICEPPEQSFTNKSFPVFTTPAKPRRTLEDSDDDDVSSVVHSRRRRRILAPVQPVITPVRAAPVSAVSDDESVSSWSCHACTYINADDNESCEMCFSTRPDSSRGRWPQSRKWTCRKCNHANRESMGECTICGKQRQTTERRKGKRLDDLSSSSSPSVSVAKRNGATSPKRLSHGFAAGSCWKCWKCDTLMPLTQVTCSTCR